MITITFKPDAETQAQINRIESLILNLAERQKTMALDLSRLQAEISENNSAITSAVTLISQIADELRAQAGNQDAVNALADQLSGQSDALAAAVVQNTPSQPVPAPDA